MPCPFRPVSKDVGVTLGDPVDPTVASVTVTSPTGLPKRSVARTTRASPGDVPTVAVYSTFG